MFEYLVIKQDADLCVTEFHLNPLGSEGWELVCSLPYSEVWGDEIEGRNISGVDKYHQLVFKRAKK